MTTALVTCSDIGLTGAPHIPGDLVEIEWEGEFVTAHVRAVMVKTSGRFGLRWLLEVEPEPLGEGTCYAICDDNGRNHTLGARVRPSHRIED